MGKPKIKPDLASAALEAAFSDFAAPARRKFEKAFNKALRQMRDKKKGK